MSVKKWLIGIFVIIACAVIGWLIQIYWDSDDSLSTWQLPLSGRIIILDPGHGGVDGGAVAKSGLLEKDIALDISLKLRDYLQESGALVLMTREGDHDLAAEDVKGYRNRKVSDLKRRVELINETGSDMFISLHLNSIPSPKWSGAQTFYNRSVPDNEIAAKFVQAELTRNLENTKREAKPISNIYLLDKAAIPGMLIEVGFLSNPQEASMLSKEEYQDKVSASIYQGLLRYYSGEEME
ncbi:N-acetylmuramoyl-L-alanine amidase CwlD [Bacillus sp. FJAT-44742]|uniref:N-acetylmuramoyl-L-alanine amidase CwlD n=1 Tax=Bacillus sp. FJAT-44742 TaxID=2014005 RepID=UPI000C23BE20|nr:N-acetylmuramoyl-L-alanine amidase CwlD [Bacillus sp. FJAT-44742]